MHTEAKLKRILILIPKAILISELLSQILTDADKHFGLINLCKSTF